MTATEGDVTLSFMQFKSIRQRSSLALLHVPNPPATATVGITDSNSGELLMTLPAQQTRFLNEQGNLRPPEEQSLGARLEVGALLRLMVATLSDRSRTMHMVTVTVGSRGFPLDILGAGDAIYNLDTCVRDAPPP